MTFKIRTKKEKGEANLKVKLRINGIPNWVDIPLSVDVKTWNSKDTQKKKDNYLESLGYKSKLREIESQIDLLRKLDTVSRETLEESITEIVYADGIKKLKRIARKKEQKAQAEVLKQEARKKDVLNFINKYIDGAEKGKVLIRKKGKPYSKNAIINMRQFQRIFNEFYNNNPFKWEDINKRLADNFNNFLASKDYFQTTKNRYIGLFKTLMKEAEIEGLHHNSIAKEFFAMPTVKEHDKAKEIYLTPDELQGLYDMQLEGKEEKVRDVFLIGCYVGQRFSDYSKINAGCIGHTEKGTKVIRVVQQKTSEAVVVPILDEKLEALLNKYDYNVPNVTDIVLNHKIKSICEKLSRDVPSLARKERTLLTHKEKELESKGSKTFERDKQGFVVKPRYAMVSSHTARRTAITNMVLSKKYTLKQMMSVSGHKSVEKFEMYIKTTKDEVADSVAAASCNDGLF